MEGTHTTEGNMSITTRKRYHADLKLHSIEFYADRFGEDVLVGKMSRFDGERKWRIYYRGEFSGMETKSVAHEWLTGRAKAMVAR